MLYLQAKPNIHRRKLLCTAALPFEKPVKEIVKNINDLKRSTDNISTRMTQIEEELNNINRSGLIDKANNIENQLNRLNNNLEKLLESDKRHILTNLP